MHDRAASSNPASTERFMVAMVIPKNEPRVLPEAHEQAKMSVLGRRLLPETDS